MFITGSSAVKSLCVFNFLLAFLLPDLFLSYFFISSLFLFPVLTSLLLYISSLLSF